MQEAVELDKYVSRLDIHRMDKEGLYQHIAAFLGDETIEKLNALGDQAINKEIIQRLLNCSTALPLEFIYKLSEKLVKIYSDDDTRENIRKYIKERRQAHRWEKNRIWLVLLSVLLLSLLIFFLSR